MANRKNFYAVKNGKSPGIYKSWEECKAQVNGYKEAAYKGFLTKRAAEEYLSEDNTEFYNEAVRIEDNYDLVVYVDGSFDNITGIYGYGMVATLKDEAAREFYGAGNNTALAKFRNVAGEILGAMHAILYAEKNNCKNMKIYYDYMGIESWAKGEWNAKNAFTQKYVEFVKQHSKNISIEYEKVIAHSGVKNNERADHLAKMAVRNFYKDGQTA